MSEPSFKPRGYRVRPLSGAAIRSLALDVRRITDQMVPPAGACVQVVEIVEKLDSADVIRLDVVDDHTIDSAAEVCPAPLDSTAPPTLKVQNSIYLLACDGDGFARFTLAHELGHVFLHSRQPVPLNRVNGIAPNHKPFEDSEWQADCFAAEMLMEIEAVRQHCRSWQDVQRIFRVSEASARIRWKNRYK